MAGTKVRNLLAYAVPYDWPLHHNATPPIHTSTGTYSYDNGHDPGVLNLTLFFLAGGGITGGGQDDVGVYSVAGGLTPDNADSSYTYTIDVTYHGNEPWTYEFNYTPERKEVVGIWYQKSGAGSQASLHGTFQACHRVALDPPSGLWSGLTIWGPNEEPSEFGLTARFSRTLAYGDGVCNGASASRASPHTCVRLTCRYPNPTGPFYLDGTYSPANDGLFLRMVYNDDADTTRLVGKYEKRAGMLLGTTRRHGTPHHAPQPRSYTTLTHPPPRRTQEYLVSLRLLSPWLMDHRRSTLALR